ncbi:MAG: hypothetical protein FRX49_12743 [Trebouxia sp. A1-2]|nr:MAG: hypothetical protein FRX49_12743 [Trebouxia sp. A1-2]
MLSSLSSLTPTCSLQQETQPMLQAKYSKQGYERTVNGAGGRCQLEKEKSDGPSAVLRSGSILSWNPCMQKSNCLQEPITRANAPSRGRASALAGIQADTAQGRAGNWDPPKFIADQRAALTPPVPPPMLKKS